ncbi:HAD family phosphatase [Sediminibacter sp. Hel_I_10]|uniref:HAD family hydrolase n=1 Tax=Sediminibacter sp. Hel_I_10 TaxID=1392490 RepID=UPI001E57C5B4|nr:HAD family phosphatase [Sediminibacter sp. Hel_I_10]
MMIKPNALLFDFDGVIVHSFKVHSAAWHTAFQHVFGSALPQLPHEAYAGKSPRLIAALFCEVAGDKQKANMLLDAKKTFLDESTVAPELLPGVHEIQKFAVTHKIPYGIASNANRQFIKKSIAQLQIQFELYYGYEDYTNPKPDPEPYVKLAQRLGIAPSQFQNTWVFEDSLVGISAAKKAHMFPVGILTQYSEQQLKDAGAVLVFPTLKEAYLALERAYATDK